MAAPPPYDDGQKYNQGQAPPGYHPQQPGPPGNYTQQPQNMNRGFMGMFGKDPVTTTCPNCQANVSNLMLKCILNTMIDLDHNCGRS